MNQQTDRQAKSLLAAVAILTVRLYQILISPFFLPTCRFAPSCSQYTIDAVRRHGAIRGGSLALRRLGKCHPLHEGGFDPAP